MKDSQRSARAFSSDATMRNMSLIESIPWNPCFSSITIKWKIVFSPMSRRQSSSGPPMKNLSWCFLSDFPRKMRGLQTSPRNP